MGFEGVNNLSLFDERQYLKLDKPLALGMNINQVNIFTEVIWQLPRPLRGNQSLPVHYRCNQDKALYCIQHLPINQDTLPYGYIT